MTGSGSTGDAGRIGPLLDRLFSAVRAAGVDPLPFNAACTPEELATLEAAIGGELPADYRAFLERTNGESDWHTLTFPPDQVAFLAAAEVEKLWREFEESREDALFEELTAGDCVRALVYHPGRIPIAYNEAGGAYVAIDQIPGPKGKKGQLVFNPTEADLVVLAGSITDLFSQYVELLERGAMRVEAKPSESGSGHWFTADGDYLDFDRYNALRSLS